MGYKNLLIPLDGSALAEQALRQLPSIAAVGAKIHLLSVVGANVAEYIYLNPELWSPEESPDARQMQQYLDQVTDQLNAEGYQASSEVRVGPIADTIVEVSKNEFDLVVIATHHRKGFDKIIHGSVSERVLHEVDSPILII